jgi:hypothetical protein
MAERKLVQSSSAACGMLLLIALLVDRARFCLDLLYPRNRWKLVISSTV